MEGEQAGTVQRPAAGAAAPDPDGARAGLTDGARAGLADWRGDVALELWVEADAAPVRIRMAGRLDATTAANLDEVVGELLADGARSFELCTDGLRVVDASAVGALADVEYRVRQAGGTLSRVAPTSGPFPRAHRPHGG